MSDLFDVIRKYGMRLYGWKDSGFCCTVLDEESDRNVEMRSSDAKEAVLGCVRKLTGKPVMTADEALALLPEETT